MSEIKNEVKLYEFDYICDKCFVGKMRPTGMVLTSYPPQYPHVCNHCGIEKIFVNLTYPYVVHE